MILSTYQCHKKVQGARILGISLDGELSFGADNFVVMSKRWLDKHNPKVGDYFVVYDDGYESCSPAEAFEADYKEL